MNKTDDKIDIYKIDNPKALLSYYKNFSKDNKKLEVKLVSLDGKLLEPSEISKLASLPSLDEARAMLLGLFFAPLTKFVRTVSEPTTKFARVLGSKRDKQ